MDEQYWAQLCDDYVTAFGRIFGVVPAKRSVLLCASVAEFESSNGRSWVGANNFGSVQLRRLTPQERADFDAGILHAGARIPGNPGGILQVDSTPTPTGPKTYPIWFALFPTQVDGISYYLKVLLRARPGCFNVVNDPNGSIQALAEQMLISGYYEGFVSGSRPVAQRSIPLTPPEQANANAYARNVTAAFNKIQPYLADWEPNQQPPGRPSDTFPIPPYDLHSIRGQQAALTMLAYKLGHPDWDPGGIDGIYGQKTDNAIRAFQTFQGITVDGDCGPETIQKLESVIVMVP